MSRRIVLAVIGLAVGTACVAVGSVVAGQVSGTPVDHLAMEQAIESAPMVQVANIEPTADMPPRGVYLQVTENGYVCVWDAPSATSAQRQGGCNSAEDPLGGDVVSASLAYDGGPGIGSVRDARLSGLASRETVSLRVEMTDGSFRAVRVKKVTVGSDDFQAFGYRFRKADLERGIGPVAVVAYDAAGHELGRQTTGIG